MSDALTKSLSQTDEVIQLCREAQQLARTVIEKKECLEQELTAAQVEIARLQKKATDACIAWTDVNDQLTAALSSNRALRDALQEYLDANTAYERLSITSIGDKVHEARERQSEAEMSARAELLSSPSPKANKDAP